MSRSPTTSNINSILTRSFSVMIAETISLGILALPKALATLGLFPYVRTISSVHDSGKEPP